MQPGQTKPQLALCRVQKGGFDLGIAGPMGQGDADHEPRQMRRALIQAGIPANAIYSDYAGFRTLDSIVRAKEVFGQAHFTVVSHPFGQRQGGIG